ncbi:MAG: putative porin [Verrucomicrobiota bacterium]
MRIAAAITTPVRARGRDYRSLTLLALLSLNILAALNQNTVFALDASDPVLNLLLEKGVISQQELDRARAESAAINRTNAATISDAQFAAASASKWRIGSAIKSVELFGDVRLRYEDRTADDPGAGTIGLSRERAAVRVGVRGDVLDNFYYGLRLDTASSARSPWLTLATSSSGNPYQGPFGKSTTGVSLGQVYLGWQPANWVNVTAGRMPNPLYTSSLVWDGDLTPEGLSERFNHTVGPADFFLNLGQFIYQDTNPTKTSNGYFNLGYNDSSPAVLLTWQLGFNYHFTKSTSLKVAPLLQNYAGHGANTTASTPIPDFSGIFVGQGTTNGFAGAPAFYNGYPSGLFGGFAANQTGINDLLVLSIPWELNYTGSKFQTRAFGDYAQNLQGGQRARAAFDAQSSVLLQDVGLLPIPSPQTAETKAYQFGVAIGSTNSLGLVTGATCRKHGWELRSYWQHVEQYALDPNLLDSDFF